MISSKYSVAGFPVKGKSTTFLNRVIFGTALFVAVAAFQGCTVETKSSNGVPSEAEYRAAVQQAADCTKAKGWQVGSVELLSDKVSYGYTISSPNEEPFSFSEADQVRAMNDSDACLEEFVWSKDLENKYHDSKLLSGAEWEADYAEMIRCLETAGISGVKVGDKMATIHEKIPADNSDARACSAAHRWQLFGNDDSE